MPDAESTAAALRGRVAELEGLARSLQARRDREQFETVALRDVARAARRFRIATRIQALLPTEQNATWYVASLDHLDRSLARLEAVEDVGAEAAGLDVVTGV